MYLRIASLTLIAKQTFTFYLFRWFWLLAVPRCSLFVLFLLLLETIRVIFQLSPVPFNRSSVSCSSVSILFLAESMLGADPRQMYAGHVSYCLQLKKTTQIHLSILINFMGENKKKIIKKKQQDIQPCSISIYQGRFSTCNVI